MADLSAFTITHYPVGQQRAIAAEFAELAAKVDDLHDDDALRWTTSNALDALLKARDAAVYAAWRADTWAMFKARREQDARQAENAAPCPVCGPGTVLGQGCRREVDCLRRPNHVHGPDCRRVI